MRRLLIAATIVALAASLAGTAALAQDPATPVVPAANQCTVEPRDIAFFEQFVGTPIAAQATPADEATPDATAIQMPEGEPADRETRIGVLDTVRQVGACVNAGNILAYFALFTDDYFRRLAETEGPLPAEELAFFAATPEPLEAGNQAALLAILDVRALPDGRAAVLIDVHDPFAEPPGPSRILYIMVEQDGRWLIDEQTIVPIDPAQVGTRAV